MDKIEELLKNTEDKLSILKNIDLLIKYNVTTVNDLIDLIINNLNDDEKLRSIKIFKLSYYNITNIIKSMENDEIKIDFLNNAKLISELNINNYNLKDIIVSLNNDSKLEILKDTELISKLNINNYNIRNIIGSFSSDNIISFINENKEFFIENKISLKDIVIFDTEKIKEISYNLDKIEMNYMEKIKFLALLPDEKKDKIDITKIDDKYKIAFEINCKDKGVVSVDLKKI